MVNPYKKLCWMCGQRECAVTDLKGMRWCERCWRKTALRLHPSQEVLRSPVGQDDTEQEDLSS